MVSNSLLEEFVADEGGALLLGGVVNDVIFETVIVNCLSRGFISSITTLLAISVYSNKSFVLVANCSHFAM